MTVTLCTYYACVNWVCTHVLFAIIVKFNCLFQIPALSKDTVYVKDPENVANIINEISTAGADKLQVILFYFIDLHLREIYV